MSINRLNGYLPGTVTAFTSVVKVEFAREQIAA